MALTKQKKAQIVKNLIEKIEKARALAFVRFSGSGVSTISAFRRELKKENAQYTVAKKTLLGIAFKESNKEMPEKLEGEIGLITGYGDELVPFKSAIDFAKQGKENFYLVGGLFEGKFVDADTARRLGMIPSREALLAQLMSVLLGNTRKLVFLLDQIAKQRSQ